MEGVRKGASEGVSTSEGVSATGLSHLVPKGGDSSSSRGKNSFHDPLDISFPL